MYVLRPPRWKIFEFFDIPVYVDMTFLLLLFLFLNSGSSFSYGIMQALELCDDATGTCSQTLLHASPLGKGLLQFNALVADNFLKYILHGFLSLYIKVGSIY